MVPLRFFWHSLILILGIFKIKLSMWIWGISSYAWCTHSRRSRILFGGGTGALNIHQSYPGHVLSAIKLENRRAMKDTLRFCRNLLVITAVCGDTLSCWNILLSRSSRCRTTTGSKMVSIKRTVFKSPLVFIPGNLNNFHIMTAA